MQHLANKKTGILRILGSVILTGLLLYAVFSEVRIGEFKQLLLGIKPKALLAYVALSLFGYFCRAFRYDVLLRSMSDGRFQLSFSRVFVVTTIRNALVDLLPMRLGELSYMYVLSRLGVPMMTGASTFGLCLALDISVLLGLFSVLVLLAPFLLSAEQVERWTSLGITQTSMAWLSAALFVVIVILLLRSHKILFWIVGSNWFAKVAPSKVVGFGKVVANDFKNVAEDRRYPLLLFLTACLRVAKYGSLYVLLFGLLAQFKVSFEELNPILALVAFISAEAAASLPVSGVMGFGAYELVWASIFNLPEAVTTNKQAIALAIHLITQIMGYTLGLLGIGWFLIYELRNAASFRNKSASE